MARKPDPDTAYRVKIHMDKGYRYASTQPPVIDLETGKRKYRRVHWGTLDGKRFVPGMKYITASLEERSKLIFPDDWDLSEIDKLSGRRKQGRPPKEGQDENRLYGDIWLLERIADVTGIRQDLIKVFEGNTEMVDAVMTMAIYPLCTRGTYNQMAGWQKITKTPYEKLLTSPDITRLTQSITEQHRMALLRLRAARLKDRELCAVDSTSRSAWGDSLADIHYGKNKDRLPLAQTTEVVVYTLDSHMPVYYRTFPGNIPDSRSLETILHDLKHAGFRDNIVLITDRGYETIRNLEIYIDKGQPMIMSTKVGQSHVKERIEAFGAFDHHPEEMTIDPETRIYYKQYDLEYRIEGKRDNIKAADRLKLNLYFDPVRRSNELIDLDVNIAMQRKALQDIQDCQIKLDDDATIKRLYNYFKLDYDPSVRVLKGFTLDEKKVARKKLEAGFYANTTHKLDIGPLVAQHHYRLRDEQEKYFNMMKGMLGADRQRNWSEAGKTGRLFILFVSQILGCFLSHVRATVLKDLFSSNLDILSEMRPIRYIEHPNTKGFITPFVGKQLDICNAFGFEIPEGCSPDYVVRQTNKGKRGRPRKNKIVIGDS